MEQMNDPFPKWARWIAQDWYGGIVVFEHKPICIGYYWVSPNARWCMQKLIAIGKLNLHWSHSLDWLGEDDETI